MSSIGSNESSIALKEWAAVCNAVASGKQQILFRKGGIHEGPEGFQPEHQEFWLFPTGFHQSIDGGRPEFADEIRHVLNQHPPAHHIPIQNYCRVLATHWIEDRVLLSRLTPFHILSEESISRRFDYRNPGIYVLVVDVRSLPEPVILPHRAEYDGCHSWVTLESSVSLEELPPRCGELGSVVREISDLLAQ
jgi:hypothetical protein